jgi:hypothetical protein
VIVTPDGAPEAICSVGLYPPADGKLTVPPVVGTEIGPVDVDPCGLVDELHAQSVTTMASWIRRCSVMALVSRQVMSGSAALRVAGRQDRCDG